MYSDIQLLHHRRLQKKQCPKQAMDLIFNLKDWGYIAGGYARWMILKSQPHVFMLPEPSDIDIFLLSERMIYADAVDVDKFEWHGEPIHILKDLGYTLTRQLPNALQFEHKLKPTYQRCKKVQLIIPFQNEWMRTYGSPHTVLGQFDFPIIKAAVHGSDVYYSLDFLQDNKDKRLHIQHINCPIAVSMRVHKYVSRGFFIGPKEIIKLFKEWDARPSNYKSQLIRLAEQETLDSKEWWEIEKLLRID